MSKEVEQIGNFLKIDGEYWYPYFDDETAQTHVIQFKKLKKEKYDALVVELVKRLKDKVNVEDLLTHSLASADIKDLKDALKALDKKKTVTQKRGCTALKIGKTELQIGI